MTRLPLSVVFFSLAVTVTHAFTISHSVRSQACVKNSRSLTVLKALLTEDETQAMYEKVTNCAEGECKIDDVEDLLHDLEEQKKLIYSRLVEITNMIDSLKKVNASGDRPVDEVRETVRAIARLFLMGPKSGDGVSMGWSGDVGKGAKTAFDVLPPKKWTPSDASK